MTYVEALIAFQAISDQFFAKRGAVWYLVQEKHRFCNHAFTIPIGAKIQIGLWP